MFVPLVEAVLQEGIEIARGQHIGGDIFGLDAVVALEVGEAYVALLHKAEERLLFLTAMLLTCPHSVGSER